ncbi:Apc15p protein-domain-containing protein [Whalleya microplaca]|nr:Apc15p protein-domain-containing protein [Whalleya microplaca]
MLSLLPDLTPRDSHSLWYTSTRNPLSSAQFHEANSHDGNGPPPHHGQGQGANNHQHQQHQRRGGNGGGAAAHLLIERSNLARLRADEQNLERRRLNVTNFGSGWLKPLGIVKTLHQLREERREAEEHQEALRREQLAQELAEAEAAGAGGVDAVLEDVQGGEGEDGDGPMDDVQLDGARDLDEDIPEADAADYGLSSVDDEDDEDEDDSDDNDDEDAEDMERAALAQQQQLMAQRMRQADDAFREDVARGRDSAGFYGVDEEVDDEDQAQMIEEDDLVGAEDDGDMDMDADLDDDIPEAEGGYEHTDTEADLSSSEADQAEMSFVAPQAARFRHSLARSDATRNSLAISDILSRDGSSVLGSSPHVQRQSSGHARRGRG